MMSKTFFRNELLKLLGFIIVVAVLHFILLKKYLEPIYSETGPWKIYMFLIPLTLLGLSFIYVKFKKDHKSTLMTYLLYTMVKIIGSLLFLSPWLLYKDETSRPMAFQFFAIFFPLLLIETRLLVRMLAFSPDKFEKK